jgi:hypothetical protein
MPGGFGKDEFKQSKITVSETDRLIQLNVAPIKPITKNVSCGVPPDLE